MSTVKPESVLHKPVNYLILEYLLEHENKDFARITKEGIESSLDLLKRNAAFYCLKHKNYVILQLLISYEIKIQCEYYEFVDICHRLVAADERRDLNWFMTMTKYEVEVLNNPAGYTLAHTAVKHKSV
jgi:hypothetical protein